MTSAKCIVLHIAQLIFDDALQDTKLHHKSFTFICSNRNYGIAVVTKWKYL